MCCEKIILSRLKTWNIQYTSILLEKLLLGSKWSNIFRRIPVRRWEVYTLSLSWRSTLFTWALNRGLCNSSTVQLQLSKAHRQLSVKLSGASEPIYKYTRSFLECLLTQTWARTTHARSQDRLNLSPPRQHYPDYSIYSPSCPVLGSVHVSLVKTNPTNHLPCDISEREATSHLLLLPSSFYSPITLPVIFPVKGTAYIPIYPILPILPITCSS